jgi:nitrite reductase/ring-hydroxylating ferredoxin subunit/DMSO/TMAO reductase YedYZ heme-binding membrane subunit
MSSSYQAISWNPQKRRYDAMLVVSLVVSLVSFIGISLLLKPGITPETLIIRWSALSALILLHIILAIGPLTRLDKRFLPLLYNRRHLGVTLFGLALLHATFATIQFHAGGDRFALVSLFTAYGSDYTSGKISHFPFEIFGVGALGILFLMAATSHDYWLKVLGPSIWKALHLGVYAAYGLVLIHVILGALQSERHPGLAILIGLGFVGLIGLHVAAALKQRREPYARKQADGFCRVHLTEDLREGAGQVVQVDGKEIALFVQENRLFALSNRCRHQGGPIGEGRILNGCITCPWHGYQYSASDGTSPPPFTEVLPTYRVRVAGEDVSIDPNPLPLGRVSAGESLPKTVSTPDLPFFVGWQKVLPLSLHGFLPKFVLGLMMLIAALMSAIAWMQNPIDPGTFEFGITREFEGVLYETPVPMLVNEDSTHPYLLVGVGKFGPPSALISEFNGQRVRLSGSLIERKGTRMIEVSANTPPVRLSKERAPAPASAVIGNGTFIGELVDTKCYLGVMRPATGKVHRACAVRCLSGGVPPGLLVRGDDDSGVVYFLVGPGGKPLKYNVEWAARTLQIDGHLSILDGLPVLECAHLSLIDP